MISFGLSENLQEKEKALAKRRGQNPIQVTLDMVRKMTGKQYRSETPRDLTHASEPLCNISRKVLMKVKKEKKNK